MTNTEPNDNLLLSDFVSSLSLSLGGRGGGLGVGGGGVWNHEEVFEESLTVPGKRRRLRCGGFNPFCLLLQEVGTTFQSSCESHPGWRQRRHAIPDRANHVTSYPAGLSKVGVMGTKGT